MNNYYGTAELTDLSQGVDINSQFCNLTLTNILGKVDVDTYFGDLIGVLIDGKVNIKANRSDVTLSEIGGEFNIDAYSGEVKIFANQSLVDLNINAVKSDVFFYDSQLDGYNFDLTLDKGNLEIPDNLAAQFNRQDDIRKVLIENPKELIGVSVVINVKSGNLMLVE